MAASSRFQFSAGSDKSALSAAVMPLLSDSGSGGQWTLTKNGTAIERSFRFKTFAKTWDFMTAVSLQCKLKNHHPEWSNVYNTTFIRWTTHNPVGLSEKDITMAALCDDLARDFGEQREEPAPAHLDPAQSTQDVAKDVVDQVIASTGECRPCTKGSGPKVKNA